MDTKEILDRIFKDPATRYELTEFENLGKPIHEILSITPKTAIAGREAGKTKYYLKSFIPFSSGNEEVQVYVEDGKANPEEIVRQLWVYKLMQQYGYKADEIDLEKNVQFGTEVGTKAADIIVYSDASKTTPKIIIECKKPKRKDGIEQLKSYMNAKGAPVAVWSNGSDNIILYRPYPAQFDDTLFDIPKRGQEPKDVLEAKKTLLQLKKDFNFKRIIQDLEELVLAKQPKEERDVLFIERILKMLRPGGRAAIVLPQGKFNNSSLAFIREWILKKARLLAVVGLHPNTFKPHTGTKTSVLFVQKYTQQQLDEIAKVHDEVAIACPDYEATITNLLDSHDGEIPEDLIPEAIADLLAETFAEPEAEEVAETNGENTNGEESDEQSLSDEDRMVQAEEKLDVLKAELIRIKQKQLDLVSNHEALAQQQQTELAVVQQQQQAELDAIQSGWTGKTAELKDYLKPKKAEHKKAIQDIKSEYSVKLKTGKERQKTLEKSLKAEQKRLEKLIPEAERELKMLSLHGKLELVLADADLIGMLKEHWIAAEVAQRLDYPIFMAVSERGGKDNSGDYVYMIDDNGNLVEDQGGQPKIDQDLVNYDLTAEDLADAALIPDEQLCIAEAFVRFAQQQGLSFWKEG